MTSARAKAIYSEVGDDPDLGELVAIYVNEMPGRIALLRKAFAADDTEALERAARQLQGAASSYGFTHLPPLAAKLEHAVRQQEPEQQVLEALNDLIDLCGEIRAGSST